MPFCRLDSAEAPTITLEVIGPTTFSLQDGFRYQDAFQPDEVVTVDLPETDLASVPFFMQWLVRSYGRHTMAALVHDFLWDDDKEFHKLRRANRLFRHAMWELEVPWIRRWLMWSAVTLAMFASFPRALRLMVWLTVLDVGLAAWLKAIGYSISWPMTIDDLMPSFLAALMLLVIAGSAFAMRWFKLQPCKSDREDGQVSEPSDETAMSLVEKGALSMLGINLLLPGLAYVASWTARSEDLVSNWAVTVVVALVVMSLVLGRSAGAGAIAVVAIPFLIVPILGVVIGLLLYALLEGLAYMALCIARALKSAVFRRDPAGILAQPASTRLDSQLQL